MRAERYKVLDKGGPSQTLPILLCGCAAAVSIVCLGSALCRRPASQFTFKNKFSTSESSSSYCAKSECRLLMAFWSVCLNPAGANLPRDAAKY